MAADMLDTGNMGRYLRTSSATPRARRSCGACTTTATSTAGARRFTKQMLRTVPGEVWLTETGGIVKLAAELQALARRAPRPRTKDMFKLVNKYDTKRARHALEDHAPVRLHLVRRATRSARFDAGLVNPDGSPRPAFSVFKQERRASTARPRQRRGRRPPPASPRATMRRAWTSA